MCTSKPKFIPLPEQQSLCSLPNSGCCHVDVKVGRSKWEKRVAVLVQVEGEPDYKIYIYTYFLKGLGAGKPLIGQIYPLNELKKREVKCEKDKVFLVNLASEKGEKITFKATGNNGSIWVAALMSGTFTSPIHETHGHTGGTGTDGTTSNIESDLKEKPDTNVYTGSREGYVPPPAKEGSGSGGKKKDMNNVAVKPDEKKKDSGRKLKKTVSKTITKLSVSESKKKTEKKIAATQKTQEFPIPKTVDEAHTNSEPDGDPLKLKKTITDGNELSLKGATAPTPQKAKLTTPTSTTPASSLTPSNALTPGNEDKKKMTTDSEEIELHEKKK
ncbi:PH-15 domain-containing protein [Caenorhabditis elegans]|uniref:PH-15 domain-containing protein n=1 Tax=Caenorhabditis elegans TaxID=6239 RepID=I7J4D0_CAEEL|nr:PH-15 domain-containing protein [Caenorhabditis elegans]CCJ09411.1 PH-15 domain-containing protein [Caenorhabditis elegans]|eukprot:NP_001263789.1 Uncharacterized protein CELE_C10C6.3 [Caenorhabditis elegans]